MSTRTLKNNPRLRALQQRSKTLPSSISASINIEQTPPLSPASTISPISSSHLKKKQLSETIEKAKKRLSDVKDLDRVPLKRIKSPAVRKTRMLSRTRSQYSYPTPPTSEEKLTPDFKHFPKPFQCSKKDNNPEKLFLDKVDIPRRFLEWTDKQSDFLTLQNYMNYLRQQRHKHVKYDESLMDNHPDLEPKMRSILLDWLMEVCDCFHLQKSTFYLAISYIDSYLSDTGTNTVNKTLVAKSQLQLLGITALFVAAKIEEIEPPKLLKFAYITDGACSTDEIVLQEISLLQTLKWRAHPVTVYDWLRLYLQTTYSYLVQSSTKTKSLSKLEVNYEYINQPNFTPMVFAQMCQMLDLAILDLNCWQWQPHELAAAILYHFSSQTVAKKASNLNMNSLSDCVSWLTPLALTLKNEQALMTNTTPYADTEEKPRDYRSVPPKHWYNLQIHCSDNLEWLELSQKISEEGSETG